jgi:hypothetical protein
MHPVKELHFYDTLFGVREARVLKVFSANQLNQEWDRLLESEDLSYIDKRHRCYIRTNKILWRQSIREISYQDLFRPLLRDHTYHGEITPEYMVLPEAGIRRMRRDLGEAKIILLARNPVKRFISAFKLLKLYGGANYDMGNFERDLRLTMSSMPTWMAQQDALNDYDDAMRRFSAHFQNVLLLPYDTLIGHPAQAHRQLQAFLGVDIDRRGMSAILGSRVNALADGGAVSKETDKVLRQRYRQSIDFLAQRFGASACTL